MQRANGLAVGKLFVGEGGSRAGLVGQHAHHGIQRRVHRIDTRQIREAGRSTQGVRLLNLEGGDKVAAAVVIPPEEKDENPTLIQ